MAWLKDFSICIEILTNDKNRTNFDLVCEKYALLDDLLS